VATEVILAHWLDDEGAGEEIREQDELAEEDSIGCACGEGEGAQAG